MQDHPKSCSTRSTQNSYFYTIGQIFFFLHKHLSQIEDTEKTGTDKAMMVGKKPNKLLTPLRRHSLITIVTGVGALHGGEASLGAGFGHKLMGRKAQGEASGLEHRALQPAGCSSLEAGGQGPSPYAPLWGCRARRTQLWRRCNTHSFNCTYTKKGEQWGTAADGGSQGATHLRLLRQAVQSQRAE